MGNKNVKKIVVLGVALFAIGCAVIVPCIDPPIKPVITYATPCIDPPIKPIK